MNVKTLMSGIDEVLACNARAEAYVAGERKIATPGGKDDLALQEIENEFRKVRHAMLAVKSRIKLQDDLKSGKFKQQMQAEIAAAKQHGGPMKKPGRPPKNGGPGPEEEQA